MVKRPRKPESRPVPEPDEDYRVRLARFKEDLGAIGVRDVIWAYHDWGDREDRRRSLFHPAAPRRRPVPASIQARSSS